MKKLICFLILACSLAILAVPSQAQLGQIGIKPLVLDVGSRPLGMGGAFAGLADDMNAAFYNPGGLAWAKGVTLSMSNPENVAAIQSYPTGYGASFGLAIVTSKVTNIPVAGGIASSTGNVVAVSYGTKLTFIPALYEKPIFKRIGFGLSIKGMVDEQLRETGQLDRSATGWDLDLGVLWKGSDWWSVGVSAQNILPFGSLGGGKLNWLPGGEEEGIPAVARIGVAAKVIGDLDTPIFMEGRELRLVGELDVSQTYPMLFRVGAEYGIAESFYVRTGLMQQYTAQAVSSDINVGLGYQTKTWGIDLSSYYQPLNNQRYLSASLRFFPEDWIVVRQLDFAKPKVMIERPIEVISLEDNIVTYDQTIEITGIVKPGVSIYINGFKVSLAADNSFKATIPLSLGKNLILVEARYEGEKKQWKYKVLRKAKVKIIDEKKVKDLGEKKEKVEELITMGVIEITPDEDFEMEAGITRGELASWLVTAAGLELPEVTEDVFKDVRQDHPLAPYIKVVTERGLLYPYPDNTFRPGAIVSKAEGDAVFSRFGKVK